MNQEDMRKKPRCDKEMFRGGLPMESVWANEGGVNEIKAGQNYGWEWLTRHGALGAGIRFKE